MFIPILLGTGREGRRSENIAIKIAELIKSRTIDTEIVDVRDAKLKVTDNSGQTQSAKYWKSVLERSIGFIIVVPEYNHGYPGELKLFLDQVFKEYENKVVGIVSVANGLWGGTRVTEQLRPVLNAYNLIVLGMAIHLRNVGVMIDDHGNYNNPELPQYVELLTDKIINLGSKINPLMIESQEFS